MSLHGGAFITSVNMLATFEEYAFAGQQVFICRVRFKLLNVLSSVLVSLVVLQKFEQFVFPEVYLSHFFVQVRLKLDVWVDCFLFAAVRYVEVHV